MAEDWKKQMEKILATNGNNECADCGLPGTMYIIRTFQRRTKKNENEIA